MKYQTINKKQKEKIAYEYLTGDKTYRELEVKYGICIRSIQRWVKKFEREYSKMAVIYDNAGNPVDPFTKLPTVQRLSW